MVVEPEFFEMVDTARRAEGGLVSWRVDRLRADLAGPLVVIGAGGTAPLARLWAELHARTGHAAWATTPLELRERPLPTGAQVLVLSASGRHHDILGAARHALDAKARVHAVCTRADAPLIDMVRGADASHHAVVLPGPARKQGLATRAAGVPLLVLMQAVYGGGMAAAALFDLSPIELPPSPPSDVVALGAGLARPAADAFAQLVRESGLAPARAADPRDFAHGAFMAVEPQTWLVIFGLSSQRWLGPFCQALLDGPICLRLSAPGGPVEAAARLYARALATADQAMHAFDARPGRSDIPSWAARIYRLPVDA